MTGGHGELVVDRRGALGLLTLNRPQALNALNDPMVDGLRAALDEWRADDTVRHVMIRGTGPKAFCAGGDIRLMHDLGRAGKHDVALDFWAREYRLNSVIKHYPKPFIALIDGIVSFHKTRDMVRVDVLPHANDDRPTAAAAAE